MRPQADPVPHASDPEAPCPGLALDRLLVQLNRRARRLVHDPSDAADLAQEAALKVWQRSREGAPIEDVTAYAMTALRNAARSAWRRRRDTQALDEEDLATPPEAPGILACAQARAAIRRLPRNQARLMVLVSLGETSPAVLARMTGLPRNTVMSRLARARARLRSELGMTPGESVRSLY